MELSFGEQIKILLNRKNMTIQELADLYEQRTGNRMSRQNLAQRLKRDNFPEQDMRIFAALLDCSVSIQLTPAAASAAFLEPVLSMPADLTPELLPPSTPAVPAALMPQEAEKNSPSDSSGEVSGMVLDIPEVFRKKKHFGEINPLTGQEYLTNTVRRHPYIDDYIQVYDRTTHTWSDVEEDYFWDFQKKKKQMLGSDYQEPLLI